MSSTSTSDAEITSHAAHGYAVAVSKGEIVAGKFVRQACAKYLAELEAAEDGGLRGLYFDVSAATHAVDFFRFLKHSKGEWFGKAFALQPWQSFILWNVFGWRREEDHTRRYRTVYIEVARKNGKTDLGAGIGLYMFVADGEGGAEVYAGATKRDQAKILWTAAKEMVRQSRHLKQRIKALRLNLSMAATASKFEPLGADSDTLDGLNVSCALVDELHKHKSAGMWEVLETATGSRAQPLMIGLTTAGTDETSFCFEQHDYAEKVLAGVLQDDSFFSYIATLDEEDSWDDPTVWAKANPNLGLSVKVKAIEEAVEAAKSVPRKQDAVRRYRCNQWTKTHPAWLDVKKWDAGAGDLMPAEIEIATVGRVGYGGLDLATTTDIAAFGMVFPPEEDGDPYDVFVRFWIPGEDIEEREKRGRVPYQQWIREGWIEATDGAVIDYSVIRDQIVGLGGDRTICQIAHDPYNAAATVIKLEDDGFEMVPFRQGPLSYNNPTKEFERLVLLEQIRHGANPVLRWMISNVTVRSDRAGNIMPNKDKKMSHRKIDGVAALIMALDRAIRNDTAGPPESIYAERGVRVL